MAEPSITDSSIDAHLKIHADFRAGYLLGRALELASLALSERDPRTRRYFQDEALKMYQQARALRRAVRP